jgi:hypothetical protein
MDTQKTTTYEAKHVKCGVEDVQGVINQHQLFFWESSGTNTVVSRDSHLEGGGIFDSDTIYSVTTSERFSTIDFKRPKDLPRLSEIKAVEKNYFSIVNQLEALGCSAQDEYTSPPPKQFSWKVFLLLTLFTTVGGIPYWIIKNNKHQKVCAQWQVVKAKLDSLVDQNRQLLNV